MRYPIWGPKWGTPLYAETHSCNLFCISDQTDLVCTQQHVKISLFCENGENSRLVEQQRRLPSTSEVSVPTFF